MENGGVIVVAIGYIALVIVSVFGAADTSHPDVIRLRLPAQSASRQPDIYRPARIEDGQAGLHSSL